MNANDIQKWINHLTDEREKTLPIYLKYENNYYEEEVVDVEIAIQRMAMLRCIFSDNLPHLSEQIMEDMLTIKTFIEKYCDDRTCHHYKGGIGNE